MLTIENINLIQRITAIIALGLLSVQIFSDTSKKIYTYFMYLFVFIQPILVVLSRYIFNSDLDPFYMYTDICVLCDGRGEYIINFLRISFYATSIAVFANFLPYIDRWFKKNWHFFKYFYFVGFYTLSIYLYNSGPLTKPKLFTLFFWICQALVLFKIFKEVKLVFKPKSKV
jgi:hypothetical protein